MSNPNVERNNSMQQIDPSWLPMPGYTIAEVALALGESEFSVYRRIRRGELAVQRDVSGRMRVGYGELFSYLRSRELAETAAQEATRA